MISKVYVLTLNEWNRQTAQRAFSSIRKLHDFMLVCQLGHCTYQQLSYALRHRNMYYEYHPNQKIAHDMDRDIQVPYNALHITRMTLN